jgi:hypothetical protein
VTDPLFVALPGPLGPFRRALDTHTGELAAEVELDPVLLLLVQSLADRVDVANATHRDRGFVMLSAEFRAAFRDLVGDLARDAGPDPLDVALAEFRRAEADHAAGPDPGH